MKKTLALILCAILALSLVSCGNNTPEPAGRTEDIKDGDRVIGKSYYENDQLVKEEFTDENGEISEYREYDNGTLARTGKNEYGEKGDLVSSTVSTMNGDKVAKEEISFYTDGRVSGVRTTDFTYNDDGSVVEAVSKDGQKTSEVMRDAGGNRVYSSTYSESGCIKTTYDGENVSKSESFDKNGELKGYSVMQNDANGKAMGSETFNADGKLLMRSVYEYENGKPAKILMYNADGTLYQTGVYDEQGKLTLYDAEGNLIK